MVKQYAVLGLGRFGCAVAKQLTELGHEVLAVDNSMEIVEDMAEVVTHSVQADLTDESAVRALGLGNLDCVVVSIGSNMRASIMCVMLCKEIGVKMVIAKASDDLQAKILYKIGADRVVLPERDMGIRLANSIVSSNILDYIELSPDYSVAELALPGKWAGSTLRELGLRAKYDVNVVAVKRENNTNVMPSADEQLLEGDELIIIAANKDLDKLTNMD